jgi:hypothetical protein
MADIESESLGKRFSKLFLNYFEKSKKNINIQSETNLSNEIFRICRLVAANLGLPYIIENKNLIDRCYYPSEKDNLKPIIALKHENRFQGIWKEEIPNLMAIDSKLKVLITYPPKTKHVYYGIFNNTFRKLEHTLNTSYLKEKKVDEFLLILGLRKINEVEPSDFFTYNYMLGMEGTMLHRPKQNWSLLSQYGLKKSDFRELPP